MTAPLKAEHESRDTPAPARKRARKKARRAAEAARTAPWPVEDEHMLTTGEVARMFRVDPKTVARWAKAGKLPSIRTMGGHRRYPEAEVRALMNETRTVVTRSSGGVPR